MTKISKSSKPSSTFCIVLSLVVIFGLAAFIHHYFHFYKRTRSSSENGPVSFHSDLLLENAKKRMIVLASKYQNSNNLKTKDLVVNLVNQQEYQDLGTKTIATTSSIVSKELKGSKKLDIVIGMAQDTDPKNLAVFCQSFRQYSNVSISHVFLFVNTPIPQRHLEIAKANDIHLIEFDINKLDINSKFLKSYHASTLRWLLIHRFFTDVNIRNLYSRILLVDIRDTFFQKNPFEIISEELILSGVFYAYKGVETITIGNNV